MWSVARGALVVALVEAALSTGCVGSKTKVCETGVVCPAALECTAGPTVFCGEPDLVAACTGAAIADYEGCDFRGEAGTCRSGICNACSFTLAGCRYDGWNRMVTDTSSALRAIHVLSSRRAYATGFDRTLLAYDGDAWTPLPPPEMVGAERAISSVWSAGPERVYVLVDDGRILSFDGTAWTLELEEPGLVALTGADTEHVYAVGVGPRFARFDGASWTVTTPTVQDASPISLYDAWAAGPDDVFVAADHGTILRYQAGTWSTSRVVAADPLEPDLRAIAGRASDDLYAVGALHPDRATVPNILHFDGTAWAPVAAELGDPVPYTDVWVSDTGRVFVVGVSGQLVESDGASWSKTFLVPPVDLRGVHGTGDGAVFAVGADGVIVQRDL